MFKVSKHMINCRHATLSCRHIWYSAVWVYLFWQRIVMYIELCMCNSPPAQVQVLSAALKAAQLDSPADNSPTETQTELHPESNTSSPSVESKSVEVQSESEESPTEEEQTMETLSASESCPVQEQGDEETQTEPLEDQEESPPDSPVLVWNCSNNCTVQCIVIRDYIKVGTS